MPNWDLINKTLVEMRQHPESFEMANWGRQKNLQEEPNICSTDRPWWDEEDDDWSEEAYYRTLAEHFYERWEYVNGYVSAEPDNYCD